MQGMSAIWDARYWEVSPYKLKVNKITKYYKNRDY